MSSVPRRWVVRSGWWIAGGAGLATLACIVGYVGGNVNVVLLALLTATLFLCTAVA